MTPERGSSRSVLNGKERRTDGAGGVEVVRHGHLVLLQLQHIAERPAHAEVRRDAAEEQERRGELLPLAYRGLEISRHGIAQTCHDVEIRRRDLLQMDHVALGEDAAPARHARRRFGLEGDVAELLDRQVQPAGLLVQEGPRARGAGRVHGKVLDLDAAGSFIARKGDQLGVLAAHLDDGPRAGMVAAGEGGLGEDLVDEQSAERFGRLFGAAAGDAGGLDGLFGKLP